MRFRFVKSAAALTVAGLVLFSSGQQADAQTFMSIDFDGDTLGSAPATSLTTTPLPLTVPYSIGGYASTTVSEWGDSPPTADSGTILVQDTGPLSKAAVFTTNPTNNLTGALFLDTQFLVPTQRLTVSFDLAILNAPTNATVQTRTLDGGPGTAGIVFGMNGFLASGIGFRFAAAPTGENEGVFAIRSTNGSDLQSFFTYAEGESYNIVLDGDLTTGKVKTYVDGVYTGEFTSSAGGTGLVASELFFFLNGESGSANSIALDNIVASVPEPVSLSVLALGGIALLSRRRAIA